MFLRVIRDEFSTECLIFWLQGASREKTQTYLKISIDMTRSFCSSKFSYYIFVISTRSILVIISWGLSRNHELIQDNEVI